MLEVKPYSTSSARTGNSGGGQGGGGIHVLLVTLSECTYSSANWVLWYDHINCKVPSPHLQRDPAGSQETLKMRWSFCSLLFKRFYQLSCSPGDEEALRGQHECDLHQGVCDRVFWAGWVLMPKYLDILNPRNWDEKKNLCSSESWRMCTAQLEKAMPSWLSSMPVASMLSRGLGML